MGESTNLAPQSETAVNAAAELASARVALRCLDKASRAISTYGFGNAAWGLLGVIIGASWHSEDSVGEGLSFRLYGDGVRVLRFHHGPGEPELRSFLEALWDKSASSEDDDRAGTSARSSA